MQINLQDSGTFYFMSDHCHVIENVSPYVASSSPIADVRLSGAMVFHRGGWLETTQRGSAARND